MCLTCFSFLSLSKPYDTNSSIGENRKIPFINLELRKENRKLSRFYIDFDIRYISQFMELQVRNEDAERGTWKGAETHIFHMCVVRGWQGKFILERFNKFLMRTLLMYFSFHFISVIWWAEAITRRFEAWRIFTHAEILIFTFNVCNPCDLF